MYIQWPRRSGLKSIIAGVSLAYSGISAQCKEILRPPSLARSKAGMKSVKLPALGSPLSSTPTTKGDLRAASTIARAYSTEAYLLMLAIYLTLILSVDASSIALIILLM
jgi:hypothetical protein